MRACSACFYFKRVSSEGGDCYNRPPHAHVIRYEDHPEAGAQFEVFAVRPPVRNDDFCNFFSHKEDKKHATA